MIKFAYVVPEEEAGFTKYIWMVISLELYLMQSRTFLGQSEKILVIILAKSFPFGSAAI